MNKKTKQVQAWKFLMEHVAQVQDPLLKRAMIADFRERALRDWGWDPATGKLASAQNAELNPWEEDFSERLRLGELLGVYISGPYHEESEARVNMMAYVCGGGTLEEIPDNIRTPDIIDLYNECKKEEFNDLMAQADNVLPAPNESAEGPESIGDILPRVLEELKARREARNDKK